MTEPTDALLPCPFCGAAPESSSCYFAFECETCGAHGPTADSAGDEAIALWNRRTPAPVGVEPVTPFIPAQRERLFYNRPYSIGKGLAMADWHRVVQYVEAAHGIGIKKENGNG